MQLSWKPLSPTKDEVNPMQTIKKPVKKTESRCTLRKKARRFEESRDNLKIKNREKATTIKKLSDRLTELKSSRDLWRAQSSQAEMESRAREAELKRTASEVDALKAECDQLRQDVENFKKKRRAVSSGSAL
jgi:predicted RNase H-like nuclease (RuvC/YqgF family)